MVNDDVPSWKELFADFSQDTTLHGVNYIGGERSYRLQRAIWAVIVLSAAGLFIFINTENLIHLFEYDTSVNVAVNYVDAKGLEFPAVTICNAYPYRYVLQWRHNKELLIRCSWIMHLRPKRGTLGMAHKTVPPNGCI